MNCNISLISLSLAVLNTFCFSIGTCCCCLPHVETVIVSVRYTANSISSCWTLFTSHFNCHFLWRYQGYISAALVLGGVDYTGPSLYTVYPHGSTDRLPFVTMGEEKHYKFVAEYLSLANNFPTLVILLIDLFLFMIICDKVLVH